MMMLPSYLVPKDECLPAKEMKQLLMLLILIQQETSHEITLMTLLMRTHVNCNGKLSTFKASTRS